MATTRQPAQHAHQSYRQANWNDLVPRLLLYAQFLLSRYGMEAGTTAVADYVLEAVTLILGEGSNSGNNANKLFTSLAATVAMLIRRDQQDFQSKSVAREDPSPVIQLASPTDLMLYLASRPEVLRVIPSRRFEEVVAELLADFGYTVELTSATRDHGIDIIAIGRTTLGVDEKYLVQCKRYAHDHHVGVSVVRELLGVGIRWPSTAVMIATTSSFTGPARALALHETLRWRLHLRDYDDITRWLYAYARRHRGGDGGAVLDD